MPGVIDEMITVPDAASIAAMRLLKQRTLHWAGGSTGTNLFGAFELISRMRDAGESGSVVTLICDSGTRYLDTYYSDEWVAAQGWELAPHLERMERFLAGGAWA